MQYNPILKKALEEIKPILKKYDVGALVVLHLPGHAEYFYRIDPGYSCLKFINGSAVRFNIKLEHYNNDKKLREKFVAETANMLNLLSETGGRVLLQLMDLSKNFDKAVGAQHTDTRGSNEIDQNN